MTTKTLLNPTWIPKEESGINQDLIGGWKQTEQISKQVLEILKELMYESGRMMLNKGVYMSTHTKLLKDSHSHLTSDDLLWYIRGMKNEELDILKSIKIKGDTMVLPRELSRKIELSLKGKSEQQ